MYVKVLNEEVVEFPYSFLKLRRENPNVSFPLEMDEEALSRFNVRVVTVTEPVFDQKAQTAEISGCVKENGVWQTVWQVSQKSSQQVADELNEQAQAVRAERNTKLSASDWTQVADAPVDQAAWAAYRQALRDITAQAGFPWTIDWPVAP